MKKGKIDYIYSSPLGQARHTCDYTACTLGKKHEVIEKDWLQEFSARIILPSGRKMDIIWDMLPTEWIDNPKMYDPTEWFKQDFYEAGEMERCYRYVTGGLDELLAEHGYKRDCRIYRTERGHTQTIVLFCHFGLEGDFCLIYAVYPQYRFGTIS